MKAKTEQGQDLLQKHNTIVNLYIKQYSKDPELLAKLIENITYKTVKLLIKMNDEPYFDLMDDE